MQWPSQQIFGETQKSLSPEQDQPNMNTSLSPTLIIVQLNEAHLAHMTEIGRHADDNHESSDEELGSNSPIFDSFYEEGRSIAIKSK